VAITFGAVLGLLTAVKLFNMGFFALVGRPFDPFVDWSSIGPFVEFLTRSYGRLRAISAVISPCSSACSSRCRWRH
jgi:hypothetical protein